MTRPATKPGPLHGVRVLEFTHRTMGTEAKINAMLTAGTLWASTPAKNQMEMPTCNST